MTLSSATFCLVSSVTLSIYFKIYIFPYPAEIPENVAHDHTDCHQNYLQSREMQWYWDR